MMKRRTNRNLRAGLLAFAAGMTLAGGGLQAAVVGQWDFENGTLAATVGAAMDYNDGPGGATQQGTRFGTTTSLGLPDIAGQPAKVLGFAAFGPGEGYTMPTPAAGNGGGALLNQWTLIMDLYYPPESDRKWRTFIEIDGGNTADSDLFINTSNGIGVSGNYSGTVTTSQWHRIAFTVDQAEGVNKINKYIDGALVGTQNAGGLDGRWGMIPSLWAVLFADNDGDVQPGYVNSIQLRNEVLTPGQLAQLGGATAAGIPQTLSQVASTVVAWIPAGPYAPANTEVGVVVDAGDATLGGWSLKLDGVASSPTVTVDGKVHTAKIAAPGFATLTDHEVIVTYTDSVVGGAVSKTNTFRVPKLFENFDALTLLPSKDDAASDAAWTHETPAGWDIDNSEFVATVITMDNPDSDGDGYADGDGITEFAGWSFVDKTWWHTKDDQTRSSFALGQNIVAVADPDEWDDTAHAVSLFNSFLKTPEIPLADIGGGAVFLSFASSWRPEGVDDTDAAKFPVGPNGEPLNNQTAIVTVTFDGGTPVQLLKWDSADGSPTFKADAQNEQVKLPITVPAGAQKMVISFELRDGANDWWWAIDNVAVDVGATAPIISQQPAKTEVTAGQPATMTVAATGAGPITYQWYMVKAGGNVAVPGATSATLNIASAKLTDNGVYYVEAANSAGKTASSTAQLTVLPGPGATVHFAENFDSLPLGPNTDETLAEPEAWTKTPPAGWTIDDSGVPGAGDPLNDGVTEWAGWSFAKREWWAQAGGDQRRTQFTKGTGTSAIADSDEWDDIGHAAGDMATFMSTPQIDIASAPAGAAYLKLDSSWRPEDPQKATITASFDGGAEVEVLRFESVSGSPYYKDDNSVNDTLVIPLNNPAGAKKVVLKFGYFDTRNNWWWAVDNISIVSESGATGDVTLTATRNGSQVTVSWTGQGTLEAAPAVSGPWTTVAGAANPYTTTATGAALFFRVKQ